MAAAVLNFGEDVYFDWGIVIGSRGFAFGYLKLDCCVF
jgi:hypothetical protein